MLRIIVFLLLVCIAAAGAAWIADQPGDVALVWNGWRIDTSLSVFVLALGLLVLAAMLIVALVRMVWRVPSRVARVRRRRRSAQARRAVAQGLLAIGAGDLRAARKNDQLVRRLNRQDPLALLLHAQTAQLAGDGTAARLAFKTMADREETRLLGLRGLFIEAQRNNDAEMAANLAERAIRIAPASGWASHAVLASRCARGDWNGALAILSNNRAAGVIEKKVYDRQRAVLLTAQALELESTDREAALKTVREALALAPALVPAATLSAKLLSEAQQVRKAMRVIEAAWRVNPHPDLADAYGHVRLGDSAVERLARIEALAAKAPEHVESLLAVTRAAIDAQQFTKARERLEPLLDHPTQRVAMLMAAIERAEHGDSGRARYWTLRAVRAAHDPAWTADGFVSDRWRPVSPVSGRIDAFQWVAPVAALPGSEAAVIDAEADADASLHDAVQTPAIAHDGGGAAAAQAGSNGGPASPSASVAAAVAAMPERATTALRDTKQASRPPPVIPHLRAPDDPGVAEDGAPDGSNEDQRQLGRFRGILSRWGG
jgi:HemY protein